MHVMTMRRLDQWLGTPLCLLLTGLRFLGFGRRKTAGDVQRILFVKLAEQGSTVLAHRALADAVQRVGRDGVFFVAFQENRFILDVLETIPPEQVLTIDSRNAWSFAVSFCRCMRRLRALKLDVAIDLEYFSRASAMLSFLTGAPTRIGYHRHHHEIGYRGNLMTHRLSFNPHRHTTDAFLDMVRTLDSDPKQLPAMAAPGKDGDHQLPVFQPTPEDNGRVDALLTRLDANPGHSLVLLNPNCSDLLPLRRWPSDRYVDLARRILATWDEPTVILTGGAGEKEAVDDLAHAIDSPRCHSAAGETTLRDLLALYTRSDVLVTNDSGPAHFAALTPVHVITLFGPETPTLFGVRSDRCTNLWAGIPCSPCVNAFNERFTRCRDNLCLQALSVDDVFAAVRQAFEERPAGRASARNGGAQ